MHDRKIAVVAKNLSQSLIDSLRFAAEIGARGIQCDARSELRPKDFSNTGRRQFSRQLENHRLRISALEFLPSQTIYEPERLDARIDAIAAAMRLTHDFKSKILVTRIGRIPAEDNPQFQTLVDLLNDLSRTGNHVGCSLAILPSRNEPQQLFKLFERTEEGAIGLCYDPAAFFLAGNDPVEAFKLLHRRIVVLKVRDALNDVDGEREEVPLGRGEIAWDEIAVLLDQAEYSGWWTVCRTQGNDRKGDVARAIRYVTGISSE